MAEPSFPRILLLCFVFLFLFTTLGSSSKTRFKYSLEKPHHPLDPLTTHEMKRVKAIFSGHNPGFGSGSAIIHSMALDEPENQCVVRWKKGDLIPPRRAEVLAMSKGKSHVLTVDLKTGRVVSDLVNPTSGYPILTMNDIIAVSQVPFKSVEFNQSRRVGFRFPV
ncbi:Amine oxidase [copper-containing] gamma 2 [Cardamine amara subsp. amara]|uniref:Amine oxidase n=1 Tax=Cardamine amara subsp. amara TaxID=228776 RepID=A0ABD0ZGW4_CARAN